MKIKELIAVILCAVLLLGCSGETKEVTPLPTIVTPPPRDTTQIATTPVEKKDSATSTQNKSRAKENYSAAPARSARSKTSKQNNMRGWDPAWEDDTHDNGMSRYMENDDDTGWD